MNGLDFALLAFLVVPTLLGFKSGLIRMAANLGGIIVGIILAGQFGGQLADIISPLIGDRESLAKILGFVIVIGITLVIATLIANVARKALSLILLGWLDRAAGTALGFIVGALFASVIVFLLDKLPLAQANTWVAESGLAAFFLDVVFPLVNVLPGNMSDLVNLV